MATGVDQQESVDSFDEFFREYYREEVGDLARNYPSEQKSLFVDWEDLYRYDRDLAEQYLDQPEELQRSAEEALRVYDLPIDVSLGQAHVRVQNLPEATDIRQIRADDVDQLIAVRGIVRKATDVRPKCQVAAFRCMRCETLTRVEQNTGSFQEPHECRSCERQGPFQLDERQSEFVDAQRLRIQESPEGLRGGETPQAIDVDIEDDVTGEVTPGDHVTATGVLRLDQDGGDESPIFDVYMEGVSVEVDEEEFEDMDITEADERSILELSEREDVYEQMIGAIAPSIHGYDQEKLAMTLQLFSGVTKHLPDESRIRGDLHILLIGDPGTGKCVDGDTKVTLGDGTEESIRELVESNLDDPVAVDDGVYDTVDLQVPSMAADGTMVQRRATKVWKREAPDRMYRIRTSSGRKLEITPSHPLFVQAGGTPRARRAEELSSGDFVAVPSTMPTTGDDSLDVGCRRSRSPNAVRFDLPDQWTPSLASLVGYVIAEGYVTLRDDNTGEAVVTNDDEEILQAVSAAFEELELPYSLRDSRDAKSARELSCTASEFVSFLERLEPAIVQGSHDQRVPDAIMRATSETKRCFLSAYVDSEGTVSGKQRELSVASMSRELLEQVQQLLIHFEIRSQLRSRDNGSYRLSIGGEDFERYRSEIGFVTERKATAAADHAGTPKNTNTNVVPVDPEQLEYVRDALALSQFDCNVPRTTYQHYERGDRLPSRTSFADVVEAFESRLDWFEAIQQRVKSGDWAAIEAARDELGLSQAALADAMDVTQTAVSYYERNEAVPDGGEVEDAASTVLDRIAAGLEVREEVDRLRRLIEADVGWERIESIDPVETEEEWVYDLEIEGTHSYVSDGIVSHNSQLLQYVRNIAPRSVYTSGKGSSSAGLCVTGDTLVHTDDGFRQIRDLVSEDLPDPVDRETAAPRSIGVQTFDRDAGQMRSASSSHVWRMPERECRRIETNHGKHLEASVNTPVLTCGDDGIEWTEISAVEPGDYVAVPKFRNLERRTVDVREFLELTTEKLLLTDETVEFLRTELVEEFGTLRDAAAALDLSEDFIYLHLKNRHVPLEKLDRLLDAIDAGRETVEFERLMIRHGDGLAVPDAFDEDLMYLLGLTFGDGDISLDRRDGNRGLVRISNGNERLLERAARIFDEKFDKRPEIEYQEDRVPCIRVNSTTIARLFEAAGMQSPKDELALDPRLAVAEHADAFVRGLMDADGSVFVRDDGGSSVLLSTISEALAQQVQLLLETYGVRASVRQRDRRGTYELDDGRTIESKRIQYFVELYGADVDRYAEAIGFACTQKQAALDEIVRDERRQRETLPVGGTVALADGAPAGQFYQNVHRDDDPGRERARAMLSELDLGANESVLREVVEADLRWDQVDTVRDTGEKEVFDLTVPETNAFVGNGIVTHNTAAAVRDDFGEGQQWSLEAGALVLADQGVAAVDELDKMRCVTGDTLVHLGDGRVSRIRDLASDAAKDGTIEVLENGRTIRDVDLTAWTMAEDGRLVQRPVTAIHEYDAPSELTKVSLVTGESVTSTPDHPYIVFDEGSQVERAARDLSPGDEVYVPEDSPVTATDGGSRAVEHSGQHPVTDGAEVRLRQIDFVETFEASDDCESYIGSSVYDLSVEGTHNFVANGMVVHNSEDRSAMHEALEQQSISISKAGINATLKSRCSLLGAANPLHGRFDQYEPMGEQIDLEPALISRFDLIFTVTDEPDPEADAELAEHILEANYAGQLNTQRQEMPSPDVTREEVEAAQETVEPTIDPELLRKYVAYAQQNCYPRMTDEARERIRDFYVELRSKGADEDAPVPVTARKLEALVRLAEASARVRLADRVDIEDAERVIEIVRSCLQDIGVDPETGQFDADIVETGTSKTQRDRIKNLKALIDDMAEEFEEGVPVDQLLDRADEVGIGPDKAERELEKLKQKGEVYEPRTDHVLTT